MKEKLPINKEIMIWARTSIGLSIEEVAHKFNKSAHDIEEWEKGINTPTYSQLERLAHEVYKRPLAVFFFPEVPSEETPKTEFRTLPDTLIEDLPSEIIKLYRKAKLFQLNLEELFAGQKPVDNSLLNRFELDVVSNFDSIAKSIRKELGVTVEIQSNWNSIDTAFKKWRDALEVNGIFIFKDAFKNDSFSGFCLYDVKYPVIFINNSMPVSRQIFTLFHELGHLLFRSGGIDFRSSILNKLQDHYRNIEVSCNKFANIILVPPDSFDSFVPKLSEAHFENLAKYFSVSREVILRNYLDRGFVTGDYYEELVYKWNNQAKEQKDESSSGNYFYNQKAYLGDKYINLVYKEYYQKKITIDNVAEYLNIKVKNLPTFEYLVLDGGKLR